MRMTSDEVMFLYCAPDSLRATAGCMLLCYPQRPIIHLVVPIILFATSRRHADVAHQMLTLVQSIDRPWRRSRPEPQDSLTQHSRSESLDDDGDASLDRFDLSRTDDLHHMGAVANTHLRLRSYGSVRMISMATSLHERGGFQKPFDWI